MKTGPSNIYLRELIDNLKKKSLDEKVNVWKRLAVDLEKPTRQRRIVNLSKIQFYSKEGETILVPGKVLGAGQVDKPTTVAAYAFSGQAKEKIEKCGGKAITIPELMQTNPKGAKVRILG